MESTVLESAISEKDGTATIITDSVKHYADKNEASVTGTLVSRKDGEKFTSFAILTTVGRNRDITSLIEVRMPKEEADKINIPLKSRVSVTGELRCRPVYRNGREERPVYEPYVAGKTMELAKSAMEEAFGLKGRNFGESENRVILTATVAKMVQINRNVAKLTLAIKSEDKDRFIETVFYAKNNMKKFLPVIAAGNRICAIAEIQSFKKDPMKSYTVNGKAMVRENPVADEKPTYVKNVVLLDVNEI